jgi:hypothetical protein
MEELIKVLVFAVMGVIWVIINLRGKQQQAAKPVAAPDQPKRASDDAVEDFLAEIRRRRNPEEPVQRGEPVEERRSEPPPLPVADVVVPERRPERRPEPPPLPPVAPPPRRTPRKQKPKEPRRVEMPAPPQPAAPPLTVPLIPAMAQQGTSALAPTSRAVTALLRNRRSVAAAFVLREILDEPLCKRRRRSR